MEDLILEETRRRMLKAEDLLARHMAMLDAAHGWIRRVCESNGLDVPTDVLTEGKVPPAYKSPPVVPHTKPTAKAIFIEFEQEQEEAVIDLVCNSILPIS
jgi:hypothetical protein